MSKPIKKKQNNKSSSSFKENIQVLTNIGDSNYDRYQRTTQNSLGKIRTKNSSKTMKKQLKKQIQYYQLLQTKLMEQRQQIQRQMYIMKEVKRGDIKSLKQKISKYQAKLAKKQCKQQNKHIRKIDKNLKQINETLLLTDQGQLNEKQHKISDSVNFILDCLGLLYETEQPKKKCSLQTYKNQWREILQFLISKGFEFDKQ